MASIEKCGNSSRIVFRYNGQRFTLSLHIKCERVATVALHRLDKQEASPDSPIHHVHTSDLNGRKFSCKLDHYEFSD